MNFNDDKIISLSEHFVFLISYLLLSFSASAVYYEVAVSQRYKQTERNSSDSKMSAEFTKLQCLTKSWDTSPFRLQMVFVFTSPSPPQRLLTSIATAY